MKLKIRWYIVPLIILSVCLLIAGVIRFSYKDISNEMMNYKYNGSDDLAYIFEENNISDLNNIIDLSDIVATCYYTGTKRITDEAFYFDVLVNQVIKGNKNLEGKKITVIESIYTIPQLHTISASGGVIPLYKGDEYFLILNKVNYDTLRKPDDFLDFQYYPTLGWAFSIYNLSQEQSNILQQDQQYTINSLHEYNIFTYDPDVLEKYNTFKADALRLYNSAK